MGQQPVRFDLNHEREKPFDRQNFVTLYSFPNFLPNVEGQESTYNAITDAVRENNLEAKWQQASLVPIYIFDYVLCILIVSMSVVPCFGKIWGKHDGTSKA